MKYIKQLNQDGYCIIKNIISKKECEFIKKKLEITHHKYSKLYIQYKGKLNDPKKDLLYFLKYFLCKVNLLYIKYIYNFNNRNKLLKK